MVPETVLRLTPYLGTFILASRGQELQFCCPFCERNGFKKDTSYHFYLRVENKDRCRYHDCRSCLGHFTCHRCGVAGRTLSTLYSKLGFTLEEDPPAPHDPYEAVCAILSSRRARALSAKPQDIGLPDEYKPIDPDGYAFRYALSRGITEQEIVDYELGQGSGYLSWRMIIPNRSETGYDMWQARDYHPTSPSKIKYRTPTGALDSLVLFNRLRATDYPAVIVCEGPISAIIAGPNAVATWGKHLSAAHVELLLKMHTSEYWIAYDGDALMDGLAAASTLFSRGRKVRFLRLPRKEDPGSLGRAKVHEIGLASPYFDEMTPAFVLAA